MAGVFGLLGVLLQSSLSRDSSRRRLSGELSVNVRIQNPSYVPISGDSVWVYDTTYRILVERESLTVVDNNGQPDTARAGIKILRDGRVIDTERFFVSGNGELHPPEDFPLLDVLIANGTSTGATVTQVDVQVERSSPLLSTSISSSWDLCSPGYDSGYLLLLNDGWGTVRGPRLRLRFFRSDGAPLWADTAVTLPVEDFEGHQWVSLWPVFGELGLPLDSLRSLVTAQEDHDDHDPLGRFLRDEGILPSYEPHLSTAAGFVEVVGAVEYQTRSSPDSRIVSKRDTIGPARVSLAAIGCGGGYEVPNFRYRAISLPVRDSSYVRSLQVTRHVPSDSVDRFQVPLVAARSSTHRLRVHLRRVNGPTISSRWMTLHMRVPRWPSGRPIPEKKHCSLGHPLRCTAPKD